MLQDKNDSLLKKNLTFQLSVICLLVYESTSEDCKFPGDLRVFLSVIMHDHKLAIDTWK
jgi:hypothetical protein